MVNAKKLDMYAAKAGLKDWEIASKIGMTPSAYSRKKRGEREFRLAEALALVELLGIPNSEVRTTFLAN